MVAGFKILNEADDPFPGTPFALPDQVDFDMLHLAVQGSGVVSGCAVTASGTTNVAVAVGVVHIGGVQVAVAAGNVAITSGHATLNRLDLIVVDNTGAKSAVAGTPAAGQSVEFPDIPANSVVLAAVWQPATGTTVAANQALDKRLFVQLVPVRDTSANLAAANLTYAAGQRIDATDIVPSAFKIGDGATAFNSLPWFYARSAPALSSFSGFLLTTGNATSATDIANMPSCSFTVDSLPWKGHVHWPYFSGSVLNDLWEITITDASNNIIAAFEYQVEVAGKFQQPFNGYELIAAGAGALVRKIRYRRSSGSGTLTIGANGPPSAVSFLRYGPDY